MYPQPRPSGTAWDPSTTSRRHASEPAFRHLRVFAVDPGLTARFETAVMNEMTLRLPWEPLEPGPKGEYVEVVDEDENGKRLYEPLDLNRRDLLASDGLTPSDGDPHFHQQMVYAVAMRTIRAFERSLGRLVHWPQAPTGGDPATVTYRRRLKLYPHYVRQANAHCDQEQGSLRFGYFAADASSLIPGVHVFTCLSQDVIAHELAHPILTGMGITPGTEGENPDEAALHEAFADLVALFLHFNESDVLRAQIAAVRGRLDEPSPLGAVALQLGQALGQPDGLRNAFGHTVNGRWEPRRPDPRAGCDAVEPHERGDRLVGAVFEAFRKIYEARVADLRRIASRGTGELPAGSLHPDLVARFTGEAVRAGRQVLDMCVRALDYLPPIDITFGDYLRAVITADYEFHPADAMHDRVAFAEAFRSYGLSPAGIGTVSANTLLWPRGARPARPSQGVCGRSVA